MTKYILKSRIPGAPDMSNYIHKDDLHDVDDCFAIDLLDSQLNIKLTPSGHTQPIKPDWFGYYIL